MATSAALRRKLVDLVLRKNSVEVADGPFSTLAEFFERFVLLSVRYGANQVPSPISIRDDLAILGHRTAPLGHGHGTAVVGRRLTSNFVWSKEEARALAEWVGRPAVSTLSTRGRGQSPAAEGQVATSE